MLIDLTTAPNEVMLTKRPMLANPCIWAVILIQAWNLAHGLIDWINIPKKNVNANLIGLSVETVYE
jgi:hypothetical protein